MSEKPKVKLTWFKVKYTTKSGIMFLLRFNEKSVTLNKIKEMKSEQRETKQDADFYTISVYKKGKE